MEKQTWVVVANSTQARIFKLDKLALEEQEALLHPESRLHEGDLVSDSPGVTYDRVGNGQHAMEQKNSPKKVEAIIFAKQVADHIDKGRTAGIMGKLYLAASPSFLGLLRQELTSPTVSIIANTVDKDITHMKPEEIKSYFPIGL